MTTIRRIFLVISLVIAGGALWALTHQNQLGPFLISQPSLTVALVIAALISGVALMTEVILLLSSFQHPEPEDPPVPPSPTLYKPESTPNPEPKNPVQKTLDAVEQAEAYLARTRHRISVVIEDDDDDESNPPKTPPTAL